MQAKATETTNLDALSGRQRVTHAFKQALDGQLDVSQCKVRLVFG